MRSSAIISNQDVRPTAGRSGSIHLVDVEHARRAHGGAGIHAPACDMLFSRTQEANLLHTTLAGSRSVSLNLSAQGMPRSRRGQADSHGHQPPLAVTIPPLADVVIIDAGAYSVRGIDERLPRAAGRGDAVKPSPPTAYD